MPANPLSSLTALLLPPLDPFPISGKWNGHLTADVGRKESPDYAVFAERVSDYALPTLFNTQLRRLVLCQK